MSASDNLYPIPMERVDEYWPLLEPHFEAFCAQTQTTTPAVIRYKALTGDAQLWMFHRDGQVVGGGATSVYEHKQGRYLNVWVAAGKIDPFIDEAIGAVEHWAREIGCTAVEIVGRKGWGRRLEGYKPRAVVFEKDLRGLH